VLVDWVVAADDEACVLDEGVPVVVAGVVAGLDVEVLDPGLDVTDVPADEPPLEFSVVESVATGEPVLAHPEARTKQHN
jgi:hypothetical protein